MSRLRIRPARPVRRARFAAAAIAGAAVLLTAACGSSSSASAVASAAPVGAAPSSAPSSAWSTATPATSAAATVPATTPAAPAAAPASIPTGYDASRDAKADIKAALAASAKDHREVLLDFGANWCPDCRVLDQLFGDNQVEPLLAQHYRIVAVNVGQWDKNLDVAAAYGLDLRGSGIPALVVIGADGKVRHVTNDGAFSNARTMDPSQVAAFLMQWAGASGR